MASSAGTKSQAAWPSLVPDEEEPKSSSEESGTAKEKESGNSSQDEPTHRDVGEAEGGGLDDDKVDQDQQESLEQFLAKLPEHIMFCRILGYFQRVSKAYPVESERFGRFADIADDWQEERWDGGHCRIDLSEMMKRFTDLFRDEPEIVLGLNEFLPPERYHINSDLSLELP
ncbi:hypothetical protein V8F06_004279 [Rhypophila decipiens]